jgi:hypothetical protein
VIIGFGAFNPSSKRIYDYSLDGQEVTAVSAKNISPYLVEGNDTTITKRTKSLADVPEMRCGNKPSDGGYLILDEEEQRKLINAAPTAEKFLRKFIGSQEFINGGHRWCLWLKDAAPSELRAVPEIMRRVEQVRKFRLESSAEPTRQAAGTPALFFFISQPSTHYIAIPEVSSERRNYIPIGYLPPKVVASNKLYIIAEPSLYILGVLQSAMHMAWMRQVTGRMKSDYQYSGTIVYNTFPWPEEPSAKQRAAVENAAQAVLDARKKFSDATLADLYDPLAMPPALVKAHADLDRAVDLCYRPQPFDNDRQRVEHLFTLYEKLTAPLIPPAKKGRRKT